MDILLVLGLRFLHGTLPLLDSLLEPFQHSHMFLLDSLRQLLKIDGSAFPVDFSHFFKEQSKVAIHLANIVGLVMYPVWLNSARKGKTEQAIVTEAICQL